MTCPSVPFIPVQKLFRINGFHAGFVHSHSSSFKGSMDVRPQKTDKKAMSFPDFTGSSAI